MVSKEFGFTEITNDLGGESSNVAGAAPEEFWSLRLAKQGDPQADDSQK